MLADFAAALSFPDCFGGNLDALVDSSSRRWELRP